MLRAACYCVHFTLRPSGGSSTNCGADAEHKAHPPSEKEGVWLYLRGIWWMNPLFEKPGPRLGMGRGGEPSANQPELPRSRSQTEPRKMIDK